MPEPRDILVFSEAVALCEEGINKVGSEEVSRWEVEELDEFGDNDCQPAKDEAMLALRISSY